MFRYQPKRREFMYTAHRVTRCDDANFGLVRVEKEIFVYQCYINDLVSCASLRAVLRYAYIIIMKLRFGLGRTNA